MIEFASIVDVAIVKSLNTKQLTNPTPQDDSLPTIALYLIVHGFS